MSSPATVDPDVIGAVPFSITNGTGKGRDTHVVIDGQRISQGIHRVAITATAHGPVEVELEPVLVETHEGGQYGDTVVRWSSGTAEALIALGWTPPAGRRRS